MPPRIRGPSLTGSNYARPALTRAVQRTLEQVFSPVCRLLERQQRLMAEVNPKVSVYFRRVEGNEAAVDGMQQHGSRRPETAPTPSQPVTQTQMKRVEMTARTL